LDYVPLFPTGSFPAAVRFPDAKRRPGADPSKNFRDAARTAWNWRIFSLPSHRGSLDVCGMNTLLSRSKTVVFAAALLLVVPFSRGHVAADEMAGAASRFLASLDPGQQEKAALDWKSDERQNWHFIPKERKGLPLKEMTPAQRKLAFGLLASGLSTHGYATATNIMSLELVLADLEGAGRKFPRDPELYHFLVFGLPDPKGTWGWRVEGHHLSANFTIVKGEFMAGTPSFFGTNPAEVRKGPRKGLRVLAHEEDLARKLIHELNPDQRQVAILQTTAPKEIFTEARRKVQPLEKTGIEAGKLTTEQRALLMKVIQEYVERVRPDLAAADLKKIEQAGPEKILFAWAGGIEKGEGHYYRVQGPTFLLEYDNTQNDNNHIHAVWRDFDGDFGEDLLRKHYSETPHGK